MRYLSIIILALVANIAQAQQVNPVTDYTFANRMSSGRSTVTDTAAYFSIGPRYGAVRGMMPPMVTDTTSMSANKRNGLLIFSIQKNKYQVWDSAGAKWADITGAAGSAIISADTAAMLAPYLRWADTTAMLLPYLRKADTTAMLLPYLRKVDTAWLSNRIDLKVNISDTSSMLNPYLRGSGTANYLPIFDASRSVINSKVYQTGTNLLFNTTTPSFTTSGISTIENNATSSAVYTFKTSDSLRAYIGWGGASTMDINNLRSGDIRFYTAATLRGRFQTDGTFRLNSLTGTGDRIVTADANGVLSATSSATGLVDTTVVSTRDWRQKGDDSLGAIIATKGSGTVTSVATGYGLSGGTITTTGTIIVDSAIVASRLRVGKVVDSLALVKQNVLTNPVTGTGTTNYVPKFTGTSTIGNSIAYDNSGEILVNSTTDQGDYKFQVSGNTFLSGSTIVGPISGALGVGTTSPQVKFVVSNGGANGYEFDPVNSFISSYNRSTNAWTAVTHRAGSYIFNINNSNNAVSITSSGELLLNTTTDAGDYKLQISGSIYNNADAVLAFSSGNVNIGTATNLAKLTIRTGGVGAETNGIGMSNGAQAHFWYLEDNTTTRFNIGSGAGVYKWSNSNGVLAQLSSNAELLLNTTTDAGDYKLQVSGNAYVTGTTVLAATSGNVGVGTTSPITATGYKTMTIRSAGSGSLLQLTDGTIDYRMQQVDGDAVVRFGVYSAHGIDFITNSSQRHRMHVNGKFTVGGLTDYGDFVFQVNGNGYFSGNIAAGTASPNSSAIVDLTSTTRGFLPPRMTTTQRDAISSPAAGLVIYNTTTSKLQVYTISWTDLH